MVVDVVPGCGPVVEVVLVVEVVRVVDMHMPVACYMLGCIGFLADKWDIGALEDDKLVVGKLLADVLVVDKLVDSNLAGMLDTDRLQGMPVLDHNELDDSCKENVVSKK